MKKGRLCSTFLYLVNPIFNDLLYSRKKILLDLRSYQNHGCNCLLFSNVIIL
jgi:hypothetical protein